MLHAEVSFHLKTAGIPVLHIKGPTVALWLYPDGGRDWGDVDVLVAPHRIEEALSVLEAAGLTERFSGVGRRATTDHAVTLARTDPEIGGDEVDVHDRFPGLDGEAEKAFRVLWRRREPGRLAHVDVWFPDLSTRALLVVLNSARTRSPKAQTDLDRLLSETVEVDWEDVLDLARRLGALTGLRAGLELHPAGEALVAGCELANVPVSTAWRLVLADAPRTALRLDELARLPWRRKVPAVAHWLLPPPAVLRMRDPTLGSGGFAVAVGYVRRLCDGMRALPASVRAIRAGKRS